MIAELAEIPFSEPLIEAAGKFIKKKYKITKFIRKVRELEEEYKRNVFENLSRQEEFDWTGLIKYIDENLLGRIASAFLLDRKVLNSRSKRMAAGHSLEGCGSQPALFYRLMEMSVRLCGSRHISVLMAVPKPVRWQASVR